MNKVKILFREDKEFDGVKFESGKIYLINDTPDGFVLGLIRRGCVIVDVNRSEALRDPRPLEEKIEIEPKKKTKKKTKKKEEE